VGGRRPNGRGGRGGRGGRARHPRGVPGAVAQRTKLIPELEPGRQVPLHGRGSVRPDQDHRQPGGMVSRAEHVPRVRDGYRGALPGRAGQPGDVRGHVRASHEVHPDPGARRLRGELPQCAITAAMGGNQGQDRAEQPPHRDRLPADEHCSRRERRAAVRSRGRGRPWCRGRGVRQDRGRGGADAEDRQQRPGDHGQGDAGRDERKDRAVPAHRAERPVPARTAAAGSLLAMVGEHLAVEFPGVIRNLDVDRRQAAVIPPRFSARVHRHAPLRARLPRHY